MERLGYAETAENLGIWDFEQMNGLWRKTLPQQAPWGNLLEYPDADKNQPLMKVAVALSRIAERYENPASDGF